MQNEIWVNARFLTQQKSGVQQFAIEISRELRKINPNINFVSPKNIINHDVAKELNVLTYGNSKGQLWEQSELPKFLKKHNKALLINLCNSAPVNYPNSIVTIHDMAFMENPKWFSFSFRKWYNFMIPKIAKKAKHIITVSEFSKSEIQNNINISPKKISVVYNGLNSELLKYNTCEKKTDNNKLILTVGSINLRKNLRPLIEAFNELKLDNHKLYVVGGKSANFKSEKLNFDNDSIKFMGYLSDNELWALYNKADLLVFPSLYEGFGIPILEALYFNCPILVNNLPVFKELYSTFTLNYTEGNDSENYKKSLSSLTAQLKTKENNKEVLTSLFSYSKSATSINKIIEKYAI
jgi:glycosyltransferase involved in cell wall biosynthesis